MNVKDQQFKIDQAKLRYNEAQEDLRHSYEKDLNNVKETFNNRSLKQSKNFDEQKNKLEIQNEVNKEHYSEKTTDAINKGQEEFKNRLKDNITRFENEKSKTRNDLNDKLSQVSESYKKSFAENDRYQDQVKKSMNERYTEANKRYQEGFNEQISKIDEKSKNEITSAKNQDRSERIVLGKNHSNELENLRSTSSEQKYKEISRLRDDNENLRTTLERENLQLKERQDERVSDLFKIKENEGLETQKNYENLQESLKKKNSESQERQNLAHKMESKELERTFNENTKNIQRISDQKIKGGTQTSSLQDELKQTRNSYENRIQSVKDELARSGKLNNEKEIEIDQSYRNEMKQLKDSNRDNLSKAENEASETLKQTMYKNREKNNLLMDKFQKDSSTQKLETEAKISNANEQGQNRLKDQRVEFGRVVNTLNEKNIETINTLKDEYSKDKSVYIEKTKKDFNQEKVAMKNEFNHQNSMRNLLYEQKLSDLEKQTQKMVDNYENKISQIARKAENEIEVLKSTSAERQYKEDQATQVALDTIVNENDIELTQLREKYERMIAKDRVMGEQQSNRMIQKYEDQLNRERLDSKKELSIRMSEAQAQFERLFKSSELEKQTLISQYEQRMENMRLASLAQENSKKA
jgi:hypothetical protein